MKEDELDFSFSMVCVRVLKHTLEMFIESLQHLVVILGTSSVLQW